MTGEILPDNTRMLRVARNLTPHAQTHYGLGVVDLDLDTGDDDETQLAVDLRDRSAERASLHALLCPTSVAVVGAGRRSGSVGRETLRALREYGFTGRSTPSTGTADPSTA